MIRLKASVSFKTIKPKRAVAKVRSAMVGYMELVKRDFDKTVETWSDPPVFEVQTSSTAKHALIVRVSAHSSSGAEGEASPSDIFKFVSRGTVVRYATMTRNFVAKTEPGVIGSGPGAGGMAYISLAHPHEGIKARDWENVIREKHAQTLVNKMALAFALGARE